MKTMMLAAAVLLSVSSGVAYAESEGGPTGAVTQFTEIPGVLAQAPVGNAPAVTTAQSGQAVHVYATQAGKGTWLFAPQDGGGANS